jgi:hypothetical protein
VIEVHATKLIVVSWVVGRDNSPVDPVNEMEDEMARIDDGLRSECPCKFKHCTKPPAHCAILRTSEVESPGKALRSKDCQSWPSSAKLCHDLETFIERVMSRMIRPHE